MGVDLFENGDEQAKVCRVIDLIRFFIVTGTQKIGQQESTIPSDIPLLILTRTEFSPGVVFTSCKNPDVP